MFWLIHTMQHTTISFGVETIADEGKDWKACEWSGKLQPTIYIQEAMNKNK